MESVKQEFEVLENIVKDIERFFESYEEFDLIQEDNNECLEALNAPL